ncbi:hypothetical protein ACJJTC_013815 [Scirpophaga incertulas]
MLVQWSFGDALTVLTGLLNRHVSTAGLVVVSLSLLSSAGFSRFLLLAFGGVGVGLGILFCRFEIIMFSESSSGWCEKENFHIHPRPRFPQVARLRTLSAVREVGEDSGRWWVSVN